MKTKNAVLLFTAAFIWGTAFVAQSVGMEYLGPFGFNGIRNFVGSLALLPCIFLLNKINRRSEAVEQNEPAERQKSIVDRRDLLWVVPVCGKYPAADWYAVYQCGKMWIYYRFLYCTCAGIWYFLKEESWMESLDGSSACSGGTVFFMYHRRILIRKR